MYLGEEGLLEWGPWVAREDKLASAKSMDSQLQQKEGKWVTDTGKGVDVGDGTFSFVCYFLR